MQDTEARVDAVEQRMDQLDQALRRNRWIAAASALACLMLVIGLSVAMPGWAGQVSGAPQSGSGASASIFAGSPILGYLVIGALGFLLGTAATILGFRLAKRPAQKEPVP